MKLFLPSFPYFLPPVIWLDLSLPPTFSKHPQVVQSGEWSIIILDPSSMQSSLLYHISCVPATVRSYMDRDSNPIGPPIHSPVLGSLLFTRTLLCLAHAETPWLFPIILQIWSTASLSGPRVPLQLHHPLSHLVLELSLHWFSEQRVPVQGSCISGAWIIPLQLHLTCYWLTPTWASVLMGCPSQAFLLLFQINILTLHTLMDPAWFLAHLSG